MLDLGLAGIMEVDSAEQHNFPELYKSMRACMCVRA